MYAIQIDGYAPGIDEPIKVMRSICSKNPSPLYGSRRFRQFVDFDIFGWASLSGRLLSISLNCDISIVFRRYRLRRFKIAFFRLFTCRHFPLAAAGASGSIRCPPSIRQCSSFSQPMILVGDIFGWFIAFNLSSVHRVTRNWWFDTVFTGTAASSHFPYNSFSQWIELRPESVSLLCSSNFGLNGFAWQLSATSRNRSMTICENGLVWWYKRQYCEITCGIGEMEE